MDETGVIHFPAVEHKRYYNVNLLFFLIPSFSVIYSATKMLSHRQCLRLSSSNEVAQNVPLVLLMLLKLLLSSDEKRK